MNATSNGDNKPMENQRDDPRVEVHLGEDEISALTADVASRWKLFALAVRSGIQRSS